MTRSSYAKTFSSSNEEHSLVHIVWLYQVISLVSAGIWKLWATLRQVQSCHDENIRSDTGPVFYVGIYECERSFLKRKAGHGQGCPLNQCGCEKKAEWQREVAATKKAWQLTQETNTVLEGAWERQSSSLSLLLDVSLCWSYRLI